MTWRLGMATGCNIHQPIAKTLETFAAAGVQAVEVGTPPRHFDLWDAATVGAVCRQLHALGVEAVSIHAPFGDGADLSDPAPERRRAAIGPVLAAVSALRDLGGSRVIVHTTDVERNGLDVGERLGHCAASLNVIARACLHMNATLVVETPLPHLIGGAPDEFAWIMRQLDDRVGVCIDTGHAWLGRHWEQLVAVAGHRLVHVHASDNHGRRDDHLTPGDGSIDWGRVRHSLIAAKFHGWVMVELSTPEGPDSEYIRRALQRAQSLFEAGVQA